MELELLSPLATGNKVFNRPGFTQKVGCKVLDRDPKQGGVWGDSPAQILPDYSPVLVYEAAKLTHNGVCAYKVFENCRRKLHRNSIGNLLSSTVHGADTLSWLISQFKACTIPEDRKTINNQAQQLLDQESFNKYLTLTRQARHLNDIQSRKVRKMSEKLAYYSQERTFTSKRSGKYRMRVAFLTLTTPETATPEQALKAFETFLDYLQRTANCRYVWKKELGDEHHHLHFHLLINNFIPYYIVNWKWKRALIAEGVKWPVNSEGKESQSHYRIEIPKSKAQTAKYIAKYLSKAYDMPGDYGYLAGWSRVLSSLKEVTIYTGDKEHEQVTELVKVAKRIQRDYVSFFIIDLLSCKEKFPEVFQLFEKQYLEWSEVLTLPQKFNSI